MFRGNSYERVFSIARTGGGTVTVHIHDPDGEAAGDRAPMERSRDSRRETRRRARSRDSGQHWADSAAKELRPARSSPEEMRLLTRLVNDAQDLSRVNLTRLAGSGTSYGQIMANKEFARRLKETDWNAPERQCRVRRS